MMAGQIYKLQFTMTFNSTKTILYKTLVKLTCAFLLMERLEQERFVSKWMR